MPDNKEKLQEKYKQYRDDPKEYVKKDYREDFNKAYQGKGEYFKIKDLKYNLRHGLIYPKSVINDLVKASYKEGVDPTEALATMMRESGGNKIYSYDTKNLFSSWSNPYINQPTFRNYLMSKYPYGKKTPGGYDFNEWDYVNSKELENIDKDYAAYQEKVKKWEGTVESLEPFQAEVRWMKQLGNKYNPGEKNREGKLEKEKDIIKNNPDLYNYMQSKYNDYKVADERKKDTPIQPIASIQPTNIEYERRLSKVSYDYNNGTIKKTPEGNVAITPGPRFYKHYEDGTTQEVDENTYNSLLGFNNAPPEIKLHPSFIEKVDINKLDEKNKKIAQQNIEAMEQKNDQ
jgi:hypothetical protein